MKLAAWQRWSMRRYPELQRFTDDDARVAAYSRARGAALGWGGWEQFAADIFVVVGLAWVPPGVAALLLVMKINRIATLLMNAEPFLFWMTLAVVYLWLANHRTRRHLRAELNRRGLHT